MPWTPAGMFEHLLVCSKLRWIEHIFRLKRRVRDRRKVRVRKAVEAAGVFRRVSRLFGTEISMSSSIRSEESLGSWSCLLNEYVKNNSTLEFKP